MEKFWSVRKYVSFYRVRLPNRGSWFLWVRLPLPNLFMWGISIKNREIGPISCRFNFTFLLTYFKMELITLSMTVSIGCRSLEV